MQLATLMSVGVGEIQRWLMLMGATWVLMLAILAP